MIMALPSLCPRRRARTKLPESASRSGPCRQPYSDAPILQGVLDLIKRESRVSLPTMIVATPHVERFAPPV
jgi:hypothetical protein